MTEEEKYEKRRAFAGERKPSMLRRCVGHDYTERRMYMVTMVTEGRRPLFGQVVGRSDGSAGSAEEPRMVLSPLGEAVAERWMATEKVYPEIEVVALQMMPDHLHGILFVKEKMERHLGMAIKGFKTGCNKAYRQLVLGRQEGDGLGFVATRSQQSQLAGDTGAEGTRAEAGTGAVGTRAKGEGKRDRRLDDREHLSFHCARVTCATILIHRGVPLTTIQQILGHRYIDTTQGYAHVTDSTVLKDVKRAWR